MGGFRGVGDGDLGVLGGGWVYNAASMSKPPIMLVIEVFGFRGVDDGDLGVLGGGWVYNASSMPKE